MEEEAPTIKSVYNRSRLVINRQRSLKRYPMNRRVEYQEKEEELYRELMHNIK